MRVLLINTPALFERPVSRSMAGGLGFDGGAEMVLPPLELAYLAAYLRDGGHEVDLFDADGLAWDRATTLQKVAGGSWDAVIASASLPTLYADCDFLNGVRRHHRGRVYAKTNIPDHGVLKELLERSGADGAIYGEPEVSVCGIVEGTSTDNLVYFRDGEVVFGERRAVEDVNDLLMPARDLLPNAQYTYPLLGRGVATVQSSRGCPFPCGYYCPYPLVEGKKWRARNPEHVVDELEEIVRAHGIGKVLFRDATFTLDKGRAHAICDEIIGRGLELAWWCETRVDRLDRELLEKMRAAGCRGVNIGVETGDEEVMAATAKRGLSMEKLIGLRNDAKEIGLALHFLMLVGFPDETRESILASYDLIQELQPESLGITLITPYPGTPLHREAAERGWIEPGSTWADYGGHQPVMHTDRMAASELVYGLEALHRGFNLLKMRGQADEAALQRALDEDYMRLQAWVAEAEADPLKMYSGPAVEEAPEAETTKQEQEALPTAVRSEPPEVSVVIPTYNRKDDLMRCLKALGEQTLQASAYEVIVCDDGSTDGTREAVAGYEAPYALTYLHQENRGPAAARNAGIRAASGGAVLFLGDDIRADAQLLERHAAAHREGGRTLAVLGHTAWPADVEVNPLMHFITEVSGLQFAFYMIKDRENVPFGYFYTSNVSVNRAFLMEGDLFDEGFPYAAYEDIELEHRLRQRGMAMVYDPEAVGYHYHPTDLERFCRRQYRAGLSAVYFARKHPELDGDFLPVSRNAGANLPGEAEFEAMLAAAAELEKVDLKRLEGITIDGVEMPAELKRMLYGLYDAALKTAYTRGIQEAVGQAQAGAVEAGDGAPAVSIVIPVYNNLSYTKKCLEAVFANSGGVSYEVIVVDNASTDGTRAYLEGLGDRVRPIFNDHNAGFGGANNQATAAARGKYLLYLNNDTEAHPGWLEAMVRLMESDEKIGIVGSKLLYPDGTLQHVGIGFYDFYEGCLPNHLYRSTDLKDHPIVNRAREFQAVTGACLMLRRGIVDEPEVFDGQFINGFEDIDLCMRVREQGYRVFYCPESVLVHHESRTPGRKAYDLLNMNRFKAIWGDRVQADFKQIMEQDGLEPDPNNPNNQTWQAKRMQAPQPRPALKPKKGEPVRPRVSLIVQTNGQTDEVRRCLEGILRHSDGTPYEVILADSGPAEDKVRFQWAVSHEAIRPVCFGEDLGFGVAVDRAAVPALGALLLFADTGLSPRPGWLEGLLEAAGRADLVRAGRACVLVRREAYERLGGFGEVQDAEQAIGAFCEQAESAGLKVVDGARAPGALAPLPGAAGTTAVVWHAPMFDPSGYADEARQFVLGLEEIGAHIRANPLKWNEDDAGLSRQDADRLEALARTPVPGDFVSVCHFFPPDFRRLPEACLNVGRTMFETDGLPAAWVEKCNEMDEIWVPSAFNVETFAGAGVAREKLVAIPGGIDPERYGLNAEPLEIPGLRDFNFLSVFDWTWRKGWDVLLRAFAEGFRGRDDVALLLKVWSSYGHSIEQLHAQAKAYLEQEVGVPGDELPAILFYDARLPMADMPRLYRTADCYVMPTRGEGWGRPFMEAMAMGVPVIGTNWSAQTEFMNEENAYLLDCDLVDVPEAAWREIPTFRGHRWAEPRAEHLKELMLNVVEDREAAERAGREARRTVMERFGRQAVARRIAAHLGEMSGGVQRPVVRAPEAPGGNGAVKRAAPSVRVVWEGSQFVTHSLALVNREMCIRLAQADGVELSVLPYEAHTFGPEADPRFERIARRLNRPLSGPADVHVRHRWPPDFSRPEAGRCVIFQPWEFGRIPAEWVKPIRDGVDEVWAYTRYVKQCYVDSGVDPDRVQVVPLGVRTDLFRPGAPPLSLDTGKSFKFLFVGGTIHRKGIDVLLKAYIEAFTREDDVCLVIKGMGDETFYRGQTAADTIREIRENPDAPEVLYLTGDLAEAEVPGLYTACDCLVHPYRGEGFGLPVAEAMACGLPVVVTRGGACDDFCADDRAFFIPASRQEIRFAEETAGPAWLLEPDADALVDRMRDVAANPEAAREKGRRASAYVRAHLTWEQMAARVAARLQALRAREEAVAGQPAGRSLQAPDGIDLVLVGNGGGREEAVAALERFSGAPYRRLDVAVGGEGPAAALNAALAQVRGEYVAIVRDDVVATADWLAHLADHMEAGADVAMVGPRLPAGPKVQRAKARYRSTKKALQKFARGVYQRQKGQREAARWLSGACLLIRAEALRALGGFDAGFRTWAFLDDFARRCRQAGFGVVCAQDTYVHCADEQPPDEQEAREHRAVACLEAGDAHRADGEAEASMGCYREALEAKPDYLEPVMVLSTALLEAERGAEAAGLFRQMEAQHPDSSRVKNYLGRCLYQAGEVAEARACFERAIELDPNFVEAYSNLGVLLWDSGKLDAALDCLNRAVQISPDHPDVIYNIAMVYAKLGQAGQAIDVLKHYLEARPEDLDARVYLAVLLLENAGEAEGLSQLEHVLAEAPEHAEALKVVAQLQEAVDTSEAVE